VVAAFIAGSYLLVRNRLSSNFTRREPFEGPRMLSLA
jgi:hypothetical protein